MNLFNKKKLFNLITLIFLWASLHLQANEGLGPKPNILILYADDIGYGDLGCYNPKSKMPTPNLDQLARDAWRFTDAHSSSGVCTPSRYALLTGRYHWRKLYGIVNAFEPSVFDTSRITMPEMLQENGYKTHAIGKWHLGWDWSSVIKDNRPPRSLFWEQAQKYRKSYLPEDIDWTKSIKGGPLDHGFDSYFGDTVINFPPYTWIENDKVTDIPTITSNTQLWKPTKEGAWECRPGPAFTGWDPYQNIPTTTKKATDLIHKSAKDSKPFFLYFALPSPHAPIIPNDKFDGTSKAGPYGDFVVETDDACGQIIQALKDSGQYDNTIIVFSADNGPEAYAYKRDELYQHWSSAPFRGLKQDLYEGGHRVPFIMRWPKKMVGGKTCDALVSQIDLYATFSSHLGYALSDNQAEDSLSLLPLIDNGIKTRTQLVHSTWERTGFGLRHQDWVLINEKTGYSRKPKHGWNERHNMPKDNDHPVELYNLKQDPGQREDLSKQFPEKVRLLKRQITRIHLKGQRLSEKLF